LDANDTIYALSSGQLPSGIAVIRVSGPGTRFAIETICGNLPPARQAFLRNIRSADKAEIIDTGILLWFPGPQSFTGEDSAELQVHGGLAVVSALLKTLSEFQGLRLAEAGEFSRRAFENNRLDLTGLEGLSDLLAAQTEAQRKQAHSQSRGKLYERMDGWRKRLIRMRALVEADFDFSDEDDVPGSVAEAVWQDAGTLQTEIIAYLDDQRAGEIVRDGFKVVLLGRPNAGKSSLLNMLADRDVAIVTSEAGTTRDVLRVDLDLGGYAVSIFDTAGIRVASGVIEEEGIRRAVQTADDADLVLWLWDVSDGHRTADAEYDNSRIVVTKDDEGTYGGDHISISAKTGYGIDRLTELISIRLLEKIADAEPGLITRERHRIALLDTVTALGEALLETSGVELRADSLRSASDGIGRIVGKVDVEELLDVIFSEFCIGK